MTTKEIKNKMGKFCRVENLKSEQGRSIPNQFMLSFSNCIVYQSYESIIFIEFNFIEEGDELNYKLILGKDWKYSNTTGKYRNKLLNESIDSSRMKIDNGVYLYMEDL